MLHVLNQDLLKSRSQKIVNEEALVSEILTILLGEHVAAAFIEDSLVGQVDRRWTAIKAEGGFEVVIDLYAALQQPPVEHFSLCIEASGRLKEAGFYLGDPAESGTLSRIKSYFLTFFSGRPGINIAVSIPETLCCYGNSPQLSLEPMKVELNLGAIEIDFTQFLVLKKGSTINCKIPSEFVAEVQLADQRLAKAAVRLLGENLELTIL